MHIGCWMGLTCGAGACVAWAISRALIKNPPGLPAEQRRAIQELLEVIMRHSPGAAAASILLALAARRLDRGKPNGGLAVRAALFIFAIAMSGPSVDGRHGARAVWAAFETLFRGAPPIASVVLTTMKLLALAVFPVALVLFAWLFVAVGRRGANDLRASENRSA
jgi:hypothetical protein